MRIITTAVIAAVTILAAACGNGNTSAQSASISLCHDYVKWSQSRNSASNHTIAMQFLHGPGKHTPNPLRRDVAKVLVYYGLSNVPQTVAAEKAVSKDCQAVGVTVTS